MRRSYLVGLAALVLSACSQSDPIERLMAKIPNENSRNIESYFFRPIALPHTASAEMLISNLTTRGALHSPKILEVRQTHTTPKAGYDIPVENFTAVLLDADAGRKIVLLRPLSTNDWYFRIYDAK